jgi:phosphatidylglycerophosphate synthase
MARAGFAGARKTNESLLAPLECRLAPWVLPRIPRWIGTHHLTLLTIAWCAGILWFSSLAAEDLSWLWCVSLMIVLQWATDHFDGKVGKFRNTGLVKWGFYMDHLLDYVFLCSVVAGYAWILPERSVFSLMCLLAVFAGFMVHSFLSMSANDSLEISYVKLGPTEFRLALVIINALVIRFGTATFAHALPYVAAGGGMALAVLVHQTQRRIWEKDMREKDRRAA